MAKSKKLSAKETLQAVSNNRNEQYKSALKEAADQGAKLALEIINKSTVK